MSPSSPAARMPPASREAELTRAEADMSGLESRLAEQFARAQQDAAALTARLTQVRAALARAQAEPGAAPQLQEWSTWLQASSVPALSVEAERERALEARESALDSRRQAGLEVQSALRVHQEGTAQLAQTLSEAEAGLKQLADAAAARARAQQEAAARARQAEQAREAPPRPPPPRATPPGMAPAPRAAPMARPAAPADSPDARRNGRVRMHTSIDMRSDSNFFTGFSMDISEGGVFIATVEAVPRGTQVELDFTLPGGRPMKVAGVVRWVREGNDRTPELMPGVGVQFTGLAPEVARVISSFVTTRDPMFYPD
ncbi:TIGR02266 family protein [Corallococcus sp. H22C18031201]|nr:TIGR02266 family protein [Corallococcus sp. H22C18031201]